MTVEDLIKKHEGCELKPYTDSIGKLTIGIGRNLSDRGISQEECDQLFQNDLAGAQAGIAAAWPPFAQLDEVRQAVIVDMAFNMGVADLLTFHNTLAAVAAGDWQAAHDGMLASKWAGQVKERALEDAQMMLTGEWPAS